MGNESRKILSVQNKGNANPGPKKIQKFEEYYAFVINFC